MTASSHPFLQRVATHDLTAALSWSHQYAWRRYDEVQRLSDARLRKPLRAAIRDAMSSDIVKISCLHRAGLRLNSPEAFLWHAQAMHMAKPFEGVVRWRTVEKRSGGSRTIVILPVMLKARHKMIASLIQAQFQPPDFIYSVRGRGRDDLIADLSDLLNAGFTAVIRCDIRDCFANVNPEALTTLPLARGVIETAMHPANLRFVRQDERETSHRNTGDAINGSPISTIRDHDSAAGPNGLMQGSPASNIAMAYLLRDLSWPCSDDVRVLVYCDDFFIVGRTIEDCRVVEDALTRYLAGCPFGPLTLLRKETSESGYFEALGYGFVRDNISGTWSVDLSVQNHDKLEALHEAAVAEDLCAGFMLPHMGDALVGKRLESFRAVTDRGAIEERYHVSGHDSLIPNECSLRGRARPMAAARNLGPDAVELALEVALLHEAAILDPCRRRRGTE